LTPVMLWGPSSRTYQRREILRKRSKEKNTATNFSKEM
jgi:hypothetical protein